VVVLRGLSSRNLRDVRRAARMGRLSLVLDLPRAPLRVHSMRELRRALGKQSPLILISPLHPTSSHPGGKPLPRMRAATLARLAGRRAIALGGMDARRYAKIAPLGFIGWAGISAFRT
jgi:thiamine-phosphate pyrophosphorylase